jgi:gliding motility-associated-like protein
MSVRTDYEYSGFPAWRLLLSLIFLVTVIPAAFAQTTVQITAQYDAAIGYHDHYNTANINYGTAIQNAAYVIPGTHPNGGLNVNRALIFFNLGVIPPGAIILQARLNLYSIGPPTYSIGHTGTNNSTLVQRVTQPWTQNTVTWNNQPNTTTANQVTLAPHTTPNQDYTNTVVTQLVIDMHSGNNYGIMLKLANEVLTNGLVFASLDCGTPAKFPSLQITYTMPTAPPYHCIEVLQNGDVTLTWRPADTNQVNFGSYHLWYSYTAAGPFTKFDSIFDLNTLTATHTGANAQNQTVYYRLTVRSADAGQSMTPFFNTARTIFLNVNNTGPPSGIANLQWNHVHTPQLPSSSAIYEVWRESPPGNWHLRATTPNTHFTDTNFVCNDLVRYRIEIADTFQTTPANPVYCRSISRIHGDTFQHTIPPAPPTLELVTVDTTTRTAHLTWTPSPSAKAAGYLIYLHDNGTYTLVDTVWGPFATTYHDTVSQPCDAQVTYAVATIDSCGLVSAYSLLHHTILPSVSQTACGDEQIITWDEYINFIAGTGGYRVYEMVAGGSPNLLTTTAAGVLSYTNSNLLMGTEYCYLIQAFDATQQFIANSCIVCHTTTLPEPVEVFYIKTATVEDNNHIKVVLFTDPNVPVNEYHLYRSTDGLAFTQIATIPMAATAEIDYHDHGTEVHVHPYFYRAEVVDVCGRVADTTNTVKTILLQVNNTHGSAINTITWNDYEGFSGAPTSYNLWRSISGVMDPLPLTIAPPATGLWHDDVKGLIDCEGGFAYVIEALEGIGNIYGLAATSLSNEQSITMTPKVFVPSGFTPNRGIEANRVFMPFGHCLRNEGYTFSVFNRFGQMIFTTNEINMGWDGTYLGKPVPEGVYAWRLNMYLSDGTPFITAGTVTLIR